MTTPGIRNPEIESSPQQEAPEIPREQLEAVETPENVAEQTIKGAEQQYSGLVGEQEQSLQSIDRTAVDLGLDQQQVNSARQEKVDRPFSVIREKAGNLLKWVKETATVLVAAGTITHAADNRPAPSYEHVSPQTGQEQVVKEKMGGISASVPAELGKAAAENRPAPSYEHIAPTEHKEEVLKESAGKTTAEQIHKNLFTDKQENVYISFLENDGEYSHFATGGTNTFRLDLPALLKEVPKGAKQITLAHTHPLDAVGLVGYLPEDLEKMKTERMPLPHFPPSSLDLISEMKMDYIIQKDRSEVMVKSQVFEPGGVWEFVVDPNNSATKTFGEAFGALDEINGRFKSQLSKEDRQVWDSKGIIWFEDKKTKKLAERYLKDIHAYNKANPDFSNAILSINTLEAVAQELRKSSKKGYSDETQQHLIDMYIGACRQSGIEMKYIPTDKLQVSEGQNKEQVGEKQLFSQEQLLEQALTDKSERVLIQTDKSAPDKYQQLFGGDKSEVTFSDKDLLAAVPVDSKIVTIAHTHPIQDRYMSDENLAEIRGGKKEAPLAPPSGRDIMESSHEALLIMGRTKDQASLYNEVIEPTGVWSWKLDRSNPMFMQLLRANESGERFLSSFLSSLPENDRTLLERKKFGDEGVEERLDALKDDPETQHLVALYEPYHKQLLLDHGEALSFAEQYQEQASRVYESKPESKQQAVRDFINYAQAYGVEMEYTPRIKK